MIVDDNAQNLYILRFLLESYGYQVMEASNGAEALEKARHDPPHLIISDILMPVMDGFSLCREWKSDRSLKKIPFIFYTATYTDPGDEEFALSLGAERFIIKPKDPQEFMSIIRNVLEEAAEGKLRAEEAMEEAREGYYRVYSERLAKKLDKKVADLEAETSRRRRLEEWMEGLVELLLSLGSDFLANMLRILEFAGGSLGATVSTYTRMHRNVLSTITNLPGENRFMVAERPEESIPYRLITGQLKSPFVVNDFGINRPEATDELVTRFGLRAYLGFSVHLHGKTIGCFAIGHREAREWSASELKLASILSRALSVEEERMFYTERMKDFIDIASHELRHPITILKGYSQLLHEARDQLDEQKIDSILEAIDIGADRLTRLISNLIDLSSIERGTFVIRREEADLASFFKTRVEEMKKAAPKHVFKLTLPENIGSCSVDVLRLDELMQILLDNAVKFSSPGSEIDIEVTRGEREITVSVLDRGPGIPEEMRDAIFDRFVQLEDALHHSTPGMGAGLYIAREIVEAHGGRIWCEPREGGGSAFRFTLPV